MLRSILRSHAGSNRQSDLAKILLPATSEFQRTSSRSFSAKKKTKVAAPANLQQQANKNHSKKKGKKEVPEGEAKARGGGGDDGQANAAHELNNQIKSERNRSLAQKAGNKALDVGPGGRSLFTNAASLSQLSRKDVNHYMEFSEEELRKVLPEGFPPDMQKEFDDTMRPALLIRQSFLDLRDNFRRIVDPPMYLTSKIPQTRRKVVLDGPRSCGKSILLAMLVHWARDEGWLVFYVPNGRQWTHGGCYYKNLHGDLWDTPLQPVSILQDFVKYNQKTLQELHCKITDPIRLGEGTEGWLKGPITMPLPQGSTLYDLAQIGAENTDDSVKNTNASVGVLVRLREELLLVDKYPVLFAIDQYNSWFTFSEYGEAVTVRSSRSIHARELTTVNAFRSMMHKDLMMVGAFSHSTAVGKLRQDLPNVPLDARINIPRYSLDEAAAVCHYYARQELVNQDAFSEDNWKKIYYLANGNGTEMRRLMPLMR